MPEQRPAPAAGHGGESACEVAALFDSESAAYDDAHEGPGGHRLHARIAAVVDLLGHGPGEVLDGGMGPGRLCAALAQLGWTVSGIDISERMVALAVARVPEARDRMHRGDLAALPFPDAGFDAAVATGVVEYLDDPADGISELVRVLRPGGRAVVSIPNPASISERWKRGVWYPGVRAAKRALPFTARPAPYRKRRGLDAAAISRLFGDAGARVTSSEHLCVSALPRPLDRAFPRLDQRLAARLSNGLPRLSRVLAPQIVVAAEKPAAAAPS
jgi:SAM-dependent methyltransferase